MDEINEIENTDEETKVSVWRKPVSEFTVMDQLKVEGAVLGVCAGAAALYVSGCVAVESWQARKARKAERQLMDELENDYSDSIDTQCTEH